MSKPSFESHPAFSLFLAGNELKVRAVFVDGKPDSVTLSDGKGALISVPVAVMPMLVEAVDKTIEDHRADRGA